MGLLLQLFLSCIALVLAIAAPSDHKVATIAEETISDDHLLEAVSGDNSAELTQSERQKRWYNYPNFGVPPLYPAPAPFYNEEEPFRQIYRKIKDISSYVRQSSQPTWQQPSHFYLPVIFVPQFASCNCPPNDSKRRTGQAPATPAPLNPPAINPNMTVDTRFPEMEDTRQNWGLASDSNEPGDQEFNRDLSFDPIPPSVPTSRPPPPVEHGSSQAGLPSAANANAGGLTDAAGRPTPNGSRRMPAPEPPRPAFAPVTRPPPPPPPSTTNPVTPEQVSEPTDCEKAIVSCCHRKQVTYQCFIDADCPNLAPYGNDPCAIEVIHDVTTKLSRFYRQKTG